MRIGKTVFFIGLAAQLAIAPTVLAKPNKTKPEKSASSDDPNKVTCKRYPVTGSLVQETKICHTRREWQTINDNLKEDADAMMHKKLITNGN